MSEDVRYSGKLVEVYIPKDKTIEQVCETIAVNHGLELDDKNTYERLVRDELYEKYFFFKDRIFKMVNLTKHEAYEPLIELSEDSVGNINFVTQFYNGSSYLNEMLEEGLDEYFKKETEQ